MNEKIKNELKRTGMKQWELADLLGYREDVFSKKLRYELSSSEQKEICRKIREYAKQRKEELK